jgi:hypothetical protein
MLTAISTRVWAYLAAAGAVLLALWRVVAGIRQAERDRISAQLAEAARRQRDTRDEIDRSVAREPDALGELRRDWSRRD